MVALPYQSKPFVDRKDRAHRILVVGYQLSFKMFNWRKAMKKVLALSVLGLGALSVAANAAPVKLSKQQMQQVVAGKITTTNPGGQTGGCGNNPNCNTVATNPTGKAPPGQNP